MGTENKWYYHCLETAGNEAFCNICSAKEDPARCPFFIQHDIPQADDEVINSARRPLRRVIDEGD